MNPLHKYLKDLEGSLRWTLVHHDQRNLMSANWSSRLRHKLQIRVYTAPGERPDEQPNYITHLEAEYAGQINPYINMTTASNRELET